MRSELNMSICSCSCSRISALIWVGSHSQVINSDNYERIAFCTPTVSPSSALPSLHFTHGFKLFRSEFSFETRIHLFVANANMPLVAVSLYRIYSSLNTAIVKLNLLKMNAENVNAIASVNEL